MSKTEYYELVKRVYEPEGKFLIRTQAFRFCSLCGTTIDSMGGPGWGSICIPCGDDVKAGKVKYDREKKNE